MKKFISLTLATGLTVACAAPVAAPSAMPTGSPVTPTPLPTTAAATATVAAATTTPTTTQPSRPAAAPARTFRSTTQRWSAEVPAAWSATDSRDAFGVVIIRSYAPGAAWETQESIMHGPVVPNTEIRMDVSAMTTNARTAKEHVDNVLAAPDPSRNDFEVVGRRDDLTISGQTATLLRVSMKVPQPTQVRRWYFVIAPGRNVAFRIAAWPDDTRYSAELDAFIRSFKFE